MTFSMDLNASPLPEEEDEQPYEEPPGEADYAHEEEHVESAVATLRREREERRRKLKREHQDEGSMQHPQQIRNDYAPPIKVSRGRIKEAPEGWLDCPAFGEPIDKIIPSKVPLDETFNESVTPGKRYSSKQVVNKQRKAGREIGLVIDLTNTSRYYSSAEWTKQGTKHLKVRELSSKTSFTLKNSFLNISIFRFLAREEMLYQIMNLLTHLSMR